MTDSLNPAEAERDALREQVEILTTEVRRRGVALAAHEGCVPREEHAELLRVVKRAAERADTYYNLWDAAMEVGRISDREHEAMRAERDGLDERVDALRDQVGRLTRERDEWESNEQDTYREAEALRAENERLRAALDEIANYGGGDGGDWVECCNIARAALAASTSTEPQP